MQTISQSEAEGKFVSVMDMAREEPVMVERDGEPFIIIISAKDYEERRKEGIEDFISFCDRMAKKSTERGMTEEILNSILSER